LKGARWRSGPDRNSDKGWPFEKDPASLILHHRFDGLSRIARLTYGLLRAPVVVTKRCVTRFASSTRQYVAYRLPATRALFRYSAPRRWSKRKLLTTIGPW